MKARRVGPLSLGPSSAVTPPAGTDAARVYESVIGDLPEPAAILDGGAGRILNANSLLAETFRFDLPDLIGRTIFHLLPPDDRAFLPLGHSPAGLSDVLAGRRKMVRSDGSTVDVEARVAALADGCLLIIFRDDIGRATTEDALTRLASILEFSDDSILVESLEGCVLTWNKGSERLYGYTAVEMIGRSHDVLIPPQYRPAMDEVMSNARAGISTPRFETVRLRRDMSVVHVSMAVAPVRNRIGRVTGASVITQDITRQRRVEEQFAQAQKMEAIGRLTSGIAHDFNNILTAILTTTELALGDLPAEGTTRADLEEVKRSGLRAAALTRQLLSFGRRTVPQKSTIRINEIISQVELMVRRLLGEDIVLELDLESEIGSICADPSEIEQIIVNLVMNARDAMPAGGTLTIESANVCSGDTVHGAREKAKSGKFVAFGVRDTGWGMDATTRARMFEPFFTTKDPGKGTGLGLPTVHDIVQRNGGWVDVTSEVGRGTEVLVYLPEVEPLARKSAPPQHEPPCGGSERILVVEDEAEVRRPLARALRRYGYDVHEARHAADALLICAGLDAVPSLVISDVVMPGMNGMELSRKLRKRYPDISVVLVSGYGDSAPGLDFGTLDPADGEVVEKPFSIPELLRRIRKVLDAKMIAS